MHHCCSGYAMWYIFWVYVCSLKYPGCNAHAPYCHLWRARLYSMSPLIHKRKVNRKKISNVKCVFRILYTNFVRNVSRYKKNSARYSSEIPDILVGFVMKLEFSRQILEKYSNVKFNEKPLSGNRVVRCWRKEGWTYRRNEW